MSHIREFLHHHRLQPGSRVLLTLQDDTTHKGQLLPLSFESTVESLILLQDNGDYVGIPLPQIQHIRETGFGPWPGQHAWEHISAQNQTHDSTLESKGDDLSDLSDPSDTTSLTERTAKSVSSLFSLALLDSPKSISSSTSVSSEIFVLHHQHRYPSPAAPLLLHNTQMPLGPKIQEYRYVTDGTITETPQIFPWQRLYHTLLEGLVQKPIGIVITYPQETLLWMATALGWMLRDLPIPVVWVGIPTPERLRVPLVQQDIQQACVAAALADQAEMMVFMPEHPESSRHFLLRPTQTLSSHTTHRTSWTTLSSPLACLSGDRYILLRHDSLPRLLSRPWLQEPGWMSSVFHLPLAPWTPPDLGLAVSSLPLHGLLLSTGRNELPPRSWKSALSSLVERGIPVYWVSQALHGPAFLHHSREGRFWQDLGLLSLPPVLPEVALSKLCWVVSSSSTREQVHQRMMTPVVGEFGDL